MRRAAIAALLMLFAGLASLFGDTFANLPSQRAAAQESQAQKEARTQARLDAIRRELTLLGEAQRALEGERSESNRALRDADKLVGDQARALDAIDTDLAKQTAELARLEARRNQLNAQLSSQREALAQLLRSAYALGRHEQLKLLLAQDRIQSLARVLAYHRYFQQHRTEEVESLMQQMRELSQVAERIKAQQRLLAQSRKAQQEKLTQLEGQRGERRALLTQLEGRFRDTQGRIAALGRDERDLLKLLEKLRDVFADIPDTLDAALPFAQRRGKLGLPLSGKIEVRYGGTLPDGRKSQGWQFAAKAGEPVRAIAPGRVAFSEWMKGYGLIVIVDHGDGYMSLYAQNDSLSSEAGDWVKPGDVLAQAGSSGGQAAPALYFELRKRGEPVDPKPWFPAR